MTDQIDDRARARRRSAVPRTTTRTRGAARPVVTFVLLCIASMALAAGYAWWSVSRQAARVRPVALPPIASMAELDRTPIAAARPNAPESDPSGQREEGSALAPTGSGAHSGGDAVPATNQGERESPVPDPRSEAPVILLRHTALDESFGVMSVDRPGAHGDQRRASALRCDRLHFAHDRGVCLTTDRFYTTHAVIVFDQAFAPLHRLPLNGVPSRVRVAPNGRLAAVTVFVSGHSYSDAGFSTETSVVDTVTGARLVSDLETFEVWRDGERMRAVDFNFWGVTFAADSDRFYATLATGGALHLVEGRVSTRRLSVLAVEVECPSLSPDQTRIAFKRRESRGGRVTWRLHVIDLRSNQITPLAETRSVDDQVEWLDDSSVLYALADESAPTPMVTDVWTVDADGGGAPALVLKGASSPAVLRSIVN